MAEIYHTAPAASSTRQWIRESKDKAQHLLSKAPEICRALFASGNLNGFLALLSRLHHHNTINLLLIYDRVPDASCLAGYKVWAGMIQPPGSRVLKRQWIGKGIEIIAPFTDAQNGEYKLVWHCVSLFDISQTNVTQSPIPTVYRHDSLHRSALVASIKVVLEQHLNRPVLSIPPTVEMEYAGIPGYVLDERISAIQIRSDLSESDQLLWLTEVLIRLLLSGESQLPQVQQLLVCCSVHCLYRIWGMSPPYSPSPSELSQLPESEQMLVLDLLRRLVRDADSYISAAYLQVRSSFESDSGSLVFP